MLGTHILEFFSGIQLNYLETVLSFGMLLLKFVRWDQRVAFILGLVIHSTEARPVRESYLMPRECEVFRSGFRYRCCL